VISKLQFFKKKISFFSAVNFSNFWSSNPGFRTGSGSVSAIRKNAGSGSRSALSNYGSTTLVTDPEHWLKGFSLVCVLACSFKWLLSEKELAQKEQQLGFLPYAF
jgi:hypothetical protein